jgi:copper chaperone CopZ
MIKYLVKIEGMMCGMCEAHINDIIRKNFDIRKLKSSHRKNLTTFISDDLIDEDKLKELISKDGYNVISIDVEKNK